MSLTTLFEKDADALTVKNHDLSAISELAKLAKLHEKDIEDMEEMLKERKDQYRKLTEEVLPQALAELGMKSFKMADGSSIEVKPFYSASIKEEKRAEAFAWLRDNGFGDLIKNNVSVRFGRNEDQQCSLLLQVLAERGYVAEQSEKVEPMTLKAWVKERVEKGSEFPSDLFGAFIGQRAVIKS
jgi:hypothetical protein